MQASDSFNIHLPDVETIEQGKAFLIFEQNGRREKIEFHDYDRYMKFRDYMSICFTNNTNVIPRKMYAIF